MTPADISARSWPYTAIIEADYVVVKDNPTDWLHLVKFAIICAWLVAPIGFIVGLLEVNHLLP